MKNLFKTAITLTTIGVAVKAIVNKKNISLITITNNCDELLADINGKKIVFKSGIKVYINGKLIN